MSENPISPLLRDWYRIARDPMLPMTTRQFTLNVAYWPIASFRCDVEFDRYRSIADIEPDL